MKREKFAGRAVLLTARCREYFAPEIIHRGRAYFQQGLVVWEAEGPNFYLGEVEGSHPYLVSLKGNSDGSRYELYCSCPFHEGGEFCKHGWAFLLDLEANGERFTCASDFALIHLTEAGLPIQDKKQSKPPGARPLKKNAGNWRRQLGSLVQAPSFTHAPSAAKDEPAEQRRAFYVLQSENALSPEPWLAFYYRAKKLSGAFGALRPTKMAAKSLDLYAETIDQELLPRLIMHRIAAVPGYGLYQFFDGFSESDFPKGEAERYLPRLAEEGKLLGEDRALTGQDKFFPIEFDGLGSWQAEMRLLADGPSFKPRLLLVRGQDSINVAEGLRWITPRLAQKGASLLQLDPPLARAWVVAAGSFAKVPQTELGEWLAEWSRGTNLPSLQIPDLPGWEELLGTPVGKAACERGDFGAIRCKISFMYGDREVPACGGGKIFDPERKKIWNRNLAFERALIARASGLGAAILDGQFELAFEHFTSWASELIAEGWAIEVNRLAVRAPRGTQVRVSSGIDWFDLQASASFDGGDAELPELLASARQGFPMVALGDGSYGLLPGEWIDRLRKMDDWLGAKATKENKIRLPRAQGPLLATILAGKSEFQRDDAFNTILKEVNAGHRPAPLQPSKGFRATLRPYQEEGLGWLSYLARIGCGGILADDMGLGKTVQVLALLHGDYKASPKLAPSIIVVPKSLLFNWEAEARRFAPGLNVHVHAGEGRKKKPDEIFASHLIVVTFATLRNDIEFFAAREFHYAIVDEAQAIKNDKSIIHEACLRLHARHRLAMTGTPVENSGADLLSLLDFAAPGLLGKEVRRRLKALRGSAADQEIAKLSLILQPFLLRRTKTQVLKDLPEKTEQVLSCELNPTERKRYDALARHYRKKVSEAFAEQGFAQSKILVLEALLRLRQAACHPALIEPELKGVGSAKLEMIVERLKVVICEGHRTLVFSQFTKFLDLVEASLRQEGIRYERLDGKTSANARQAAVARFQEDRGPPVFLVSLKAGGVGLNLTAASYVFLLDPWWNPAAEAQAIDRSHRIGQKNAVLAYRLIAKGTVEEKVLLLQQEKRALADSLLGDGTAALRALDAGDIMALLE